MGPGRGRHPHHNDACLVSGHSDSDLGNLWSGAFGENCLHRPLCLLPWDGYGREGVGCLWHPSPCLMTLTMSSLCTFCLHLEPMGQDWSCDYFQDFCPPYCAPYLVLRLFLLGSQKGSPQSLSPPQGGRL